MANLPTPVTDEERATAVLARVGALASRLGIETFWLEQAARRVGTSPGRYLRVWIDTEMPRLAIRCEHAGPGLATRPARARYLELDSAGGEVEIAVGTRAFADDRTLLASVPADAVDAIAKHLDAIGNGRCDAIARIIGGTAWMATLVESTPAELPAATSQLGVLAESLGVEPHQRALLESSHVSLGERGYTVTFTADRTGVRPHVTLEYRGVPWKQVVGLIDALRPGTSSSTVLGAFAGALGGEVASGLAVTYRAGKAAHVRVAIDTEPDVF